MSLAGRGSGKVARGLLVDIKRLNNGLVKADALTGKFGRNVGNYGSALNRATASLRSFAGAIGLTSGIFLLVQGFRDAFSTIKDFEQANANLASILGTTKDKVVDLTKDAKRLGEVSVFTASQITSLQTELAKLGFNRREILASTEAIQSLAAATGTELAQSAIQVGSALRIFNLDASEAGRVVDVLAQSTTKSALDMSKLATALPIVGTTADVAGVSLERTTALLGVLSDRGLDASTSGTALRNIFLDLAEKGLTWEEAMSKINNATNKNATALGLFGKRGATSAIVLAENADASDKLTKSLLLSGGAAEKMANTQIDTLSGSIKLLKSAWEGVVLGFAEGNGALNGLKNTIQFVAKNLKTIIGLVVTLTKVFISFKAVMFALKMNDRVKEWVSFRKEVKKGGTAMSSASKNAKGFGKALKGIGLALALTALIELAVAFYDIASGAAEARRQQDLFNEATKTASDFGEHFNNQSEERIKLKTKELQLLVAEGKLTQKQMDLQLRDLQLKKENEALDVISRAKKRIKTIELETAALESLKESRLINEDNFSKSESGQRAYANAIDRVNSANTISNKTIKENTDRIVKQNAIIKEFDAIVVNTSDNIHDYTVRIADNSGKIRANTDNLKDNTDAKKKNNAAEEEEQRLFDLKSQQQKDVKDNSDDNDSIREEEARKAQEALDKKNQQQEDADKQRLDREKKLAEERLKRQKDNFQQLTNLLNSTLEIQQGKIDSQIESSRINITESQSAVDNLQEQAKLGNADAQASIKAEKQKIANEKGNIDALEKKKRDLQILVTGLAFANQKIQAGDGNALENAGSDMKDFIAKLEGKYEGTNTTLGADLGNAYAITGDRDTHIIKAHKDEYIIGVDNSRKLGGMNQEEIVAGALMYKNGEFVGNRAVNAVNQVSSFNDSRLLSYQQKTIEAINNIQIPEHHFNYDAVNKMATESIRIGNKTIHNHSKNGGLFS